MAKLASEEWGAYITSRQGGGDEIGHVTPSTFTLTFNSKIGSFKSKQSTVKK